MNPAGHEYALEWLSTLEGFESNNYMAITSEGHGARTLRSAGRDKEYKSV